MKNYKSIFIIFVLLVLIPSLSLANGLNLNGLGARAVAMGGAFVGLANDFSAVFWNPAGMAQFNQKTFGFYGTDLIPSATFKFDMPTLAGPVNMVDAKTKTKHYMAGMAAYYHPINENLVAGFGIYTPSGLGADWNGADFAAISNDTSYKWHSKVAVVTFSPALAYKISDQVMIGGSLNINYGTFDISTHAGMRELPLGGGLSMDFDLGQQDESLKGWGYSATLGALVKPIDNLSLGATFRTACKMTLDGEASISNFPYIPFFPVPDTSDLSGDVTWPMWIAFGAAFKPIDQLTLTADLHYTDWKKIDVISFEFTDPIWQAATAGTGSAAMEMLWKSKLQIRFGAEYTLNGYSFRGGYYWDPAPAPDKTMNVLLPNFDFSGITCGFGYSINSLQIDLGFEYLMGSDRDIPVLVPPEVNKMPGLYTMKVLVPNFSVSYSW